jgi:hypothetical protein
MKPEMLFFEVAAFCALLLLVRHSARTEGLRTAALFFIYLLAMAVFREWLVYSLTRSIDKPVPYSSDATMGRIGFVNLVVVAGWVFTTYLSFGLARLIQRRNFEGTNVFFTLAMTALVTTAISYAVETAGMRLGLWTWTQSNRRPVAWLPFEWPFDAFEGWAATSFMIVSVYCALRFRLFSPVRWRSVSITAALLALYSVADLTVRWLGPSSPRKKLTVIYIAAAVVLGFVAPKRLLGTSDEALKE